MAAAHYHGFGFIDINPTLNINNHSNNGGSGNSSYIIRLIIVLCDLNDMVRNSIEEKQGYMI
ncbi:MAG: hypothetical protein WAM14_10610 [Candidatus Nitrosopolaris sp.]